MTYIFQQARNTGAHGVAVVVIYQYVGNSLISPCSVPAATVRETRIN
jgi:hypothetical protein